MCILFIAAGAHPRYPLIIAANRDEYHARPSAPMQRWREWPHILAGRDLQAGGTWFGVSASGRIAAVTNLRGAELAAAGEGRSRGELVVRFLRGDDSVSAFGEFLRARHGCFKPFNLMYGTPDELRCFDGTDAHEYALGGGVHCISNGAPGEEWPKMSRGVGLLQAVLARPAVAPQDLFGVMTDHATAAPQSLPQTGLSAARERQLSSIFVRAGDYGTRATTLLFAAPRRFDLWEQNYAADGEATERRQHRLTLTPA